MGSGTLTISSAISGGAGSLEKLGTGTLALSGSSSFTGGTTLAAGTTQIASIANVSTASPLGAPASVTLGSSGNTATLEYTGTTASPSSTMPFTLGGTASIQVDNAATNLTLSGAIGGSGTLTKAGGGTLTLGAASNTYSGGTVVSGGTLVTTADAQLGSSTAAITVSNGAVWSVGYEGTLAAPINRPIILGSGGGTLTLTAGALFTSSTFEGGGGLIVNGGTLVPYPSAPVDIGPVTITGTGAKILIGDSYANGANFLANNTSFNVINGGNLSFGDEQGTMTVNNFITFASGTLLSERGTAVVLSTSTVTFPTAGTMILQGDNSGSSGTITINGAWQTLTGNLALQLGNNGNGGTVVLNGRHERCL